VLAALTGLMILAVVARPNGLGRQFEAWLVGNVPDTAGPSPADLHLGEGLPDPLVLGYYDAAGTAGLANLESYGNTLTGIVPFWYTIHADGSVTGSADQAVLDYAAGHKMWVFALVQNMTGASVYHALFTDPLARARALQSLLGLVETEGYDGLNLDFEGIAPEDRARYTSFVADLSSLLHRNGYYLTLSVPAETKDAPSNGWSGAYDYAALGRYADVVMIMAYDQHFEGGSAGPVAGTSWVEEVARYAVSAIPPSKVVLGIPAYGYDWGGGTTQALSYAQWQELLKTYNSATAAQTGHLMYYSHGVLHDVYFESMADMEAAVKIAAGSNMRGVVLWRLGIEDPTIWQYVRS